MGTPRAVWPPAVFFSGAPSLTPFRIVPWRRAWPWKDRKHSSRASQHLTNILGDEWTSTFHIIMCMYVCIPIEILPFFFGSKSSDGIFGSRFLFRGVFQVFIFDPELAELPWTGSCGTLNFPSCPVWLCLDIRKYSSSPGFSPTYTEVCWERRVGHLIYEEGKTSKLFEIGPTASSSSYPIQIIHSSCWSGCLAGCWITCFFC